MKLLEPASSQTRQHKNSKTWTMIGLETVCKWNSRSVILGGS